MRIAVIGGGPAGCEAAARLASAGIETVLFDPTFDREKPCGGGVPWRCLKEFDGMLKDRIPACEVRQVVFEAPSGASASVSLPAPLRVFSRRTLDGWWAERAQQRGARLRRERIVSVLGAGRAVVRTSGGTQEPFDIVVGADGARSGVRRAFWRPFEREELSQAVGYYVPGRTDDTARLGFVEGLAGYLWSFPRPDHLAIGACAPLDRHDSAHLRAALDRYLRHLDPALDPSQLPFYSALIPSLTPAALASNRTAGPGWCLVGDAAGTVDPLTREGIYYALKSAALAADAIRAGRPQDYPAAWDAAHGAEFRWAAERRDRFFEPELTDRLVRSLDISSAVRKVMVDLILGVQPYRTLKRRLIRSSLPLALDWVLRRFFG